MTDLSSIASKFGVNVTPDKINALGNGLINDTFIVRTAPQNEPDFVLQRINHNIFHNVGILQHNIECVTAHIRSKLIQRGIKDIERRSLHFLKAIGTDKTYVKADDEYWRMMVYIPDSVTKEIVDAESSYQTGIAFGDFQSMLADIPDKLYETIPDFHNMEFRIRQFKETIDKDLAGRVGQTQYLIDQLLAREEKMTVAERLYREGKLPKRICHCDTKVNNILFDKQGNILCVIDLDTVMPSFVFSDFGDFLRTAANTGQEDDVNLDNVGFNMDIFRSFAKGYVSAAKFLTPIEKSMLPFAALLFPYMQSVRFLTDYLNNDTYYKISYPEHNLVRTKSQFKLLQSAEAHEQEMSAFIKSL